MRVKIIERDINGNLMVHPFDSRYDAYVYAMGRVKDDPDGDILLVFQQDACVYSSLGSAKITWEDLTGFFA